MKKYAAEFIGTMVLTWGNGKGKEQYGCRPCDRPYPGIRAYPWYPAYRNER